MPSFCMRDWRVVRFSPSSAAAPWEPPMIPLLECSACTIASRWTSASETCQWKFFVLMHRANTSASRRFRAADRSFVA